MGEMPLTRYPIAPALSIPSTVAWSVVCGQSEHGGAR